MGWGTFNPRELLKYIWQLSKEPKLCMIEFLGINCPSYHRPEPPRAVIHHMLMASQDTTAADGPGCLHGPAAGLHDTVHAVRRDWSVIQDTRFTGSSSYALHLSGNAHSKSILHRHEHSTLAWRIAV